MWLAELKPVAPPKVNLDTQALFEAAKSNPPATFRSGDVVLAKRADMPKDQDHAAQIILDLATIFDEADADKDGKLTLAEWHNKCGQWLEMDQLTMLFIQCDTNGDGTLDKEEFTVGCANKYLIKWAQVVGDRMMFAVSQSTVGTTTLLCVVLIREQCPVAPVHAVALDVQYYSELSVSPFKIQC